MSEIKTIQFSSKLFRANKDLFNNKGKLIYRANTNTNILASNNYKNAPLKYFTLNKSELSAYTKEGTTYKKEWNVINNLNLVDILDLNTRKALEKEFNSPELKNALKYAFPINNNNNKVSRNSFNVKIDNKILNKICELGYDGYYMKTIDAFHSEVGLCNKAFSKLKLLKSDRTIEAPRIPSKTKRRSRLINYNNNMGGGRRTTIKQNKNKK